MTLFNSGATFLCTLVNNYVIASEAGTQTPCRITLVLVGQTNVSSRSPSIFLVTTRHFPGDIQERFFFTFPCAGVIASEAIQWWTLVPSDPENAGKSASEKKADEEGYLGGPYVLIQVT